MNMKMLFRIFCALLALAVMLPCALAENPSDDVSGYNPFDTDDSSGGDDDGAVAALPTATSAPQVLATPIPASMTDPFGTGGSPSATAAPAVPASTVMYVAATTARITKKAKLNGHTLTILGYGDKVTVTASQGDWVRVQTEQGLSGFCQLSSLSQADPNTMSKQMYAQVSKLAMSKSPTEKSGRVRTLQRDETVTVLAITPDGQWSRVTDGSKTGFVPTWCLDDAPYAEGTAVWCCQGATDLMVNPDAWIRVSTLSYAQQVRLLGYLNNNTIAKIRSDKGYVSYCDVNALTTADPATLSTPVYAQATGYVLSNGTGSDASHFNLKKNTMMTLLGVDPNSNWALVKTGKRKLYIPYVFLGNDRPGKAYKVVINNQDAPLYQSYKEDAAILGTLPMGTRLNLLGGNGSFAKVSTVTTGGQSVTGFIGIQYLRAETPLATATAAPTAAAFDFFS